jgi:hypothetical protein
MQICWVLVCFLYSEFKLWSFIVMLLVTHACDPHLPGGRDQEDHGLKPAQANSSQDTISKKTHHKKGLVEWFKA